MASAIDQPFIDLNSISGTALPSRHRVLAALIDRLLPMLKAYPETGLAPFLGEWRNQHAYDGSLCEVDMGGSVLAGRIEGITAAGKDVPGHVRVELSVREGTVFIDVMDNGKGFPQENRQRLLEPYMTTRAEGTGLGLAIVAKILEDHGGGIELLDAPALDNSVPSPHGEANGAWVRLHFPLATPDAGSGDAQPSSTHSAQREASAS